MVLELQPIYETIWEINYQHPLWWTVFLEDIILNNNISYINHTTIIVSVYDISEDNIIIFYEILKKMKINHLVNKVINKREFVIIHLRSELVMKYLTSHNRWLSIVTYGILLKKFSPNSLELSPNDKEDLKLLDRGTVYHFYTEPQEVIKSNRNHKYIYLYKELNRKYVNNLDYQVKYLWNYQEFWDNFKSCLE